jgi:hypothetical protein
MVHELRQLPLPSGILVRPVPAQDRDSSSCSGQSPGKSRSLQIYNENQKVHKDAEMMVVTHFAFSVDRTSRLSCIGDAALV